MDSPVLNVVMSGSGDVFGRSFRGFTHLQAASDRFVRLSFDILGGHAALGRQLTIRLVEGLDEIGKLVVTGECFWYRHESHSFAPSLHWPAVALKRA